MLRILRIIHQTAGVLGAFIILVMAITGLLLNHRSLIGYSSSTKFELQKIIFSLHSGSIGDASFVWLIDLGAICMIVLSFTGLWLWINLTVKKKFVIKRRNNS